MSVALITSTYYRPYFQAVIAPVKLVYAVFLKALGYLLFFLGAKEWGKTLQVKGEQIDSRCTSLLTGLWAYGRRFLVHSDNYEHSCRGSCYWIIHKHLCDPQKPLTELAKMFEGGAPRDAIEMHKNNQIPRNLIETKQWEQHFKDRLPCIPRLAPGVYTFLIGFSKDKDTPCKAHRIALFKQKESLLFDPNTGLSKWVDDDWTPLLTLTMETIRTDPSGYFTIECYSYSI